MRRSVTRKTDRETLGVLTCEIVALKGRVGQGLYEIGVRLARVHDEELWIAGHDSFEGYLGDAVGLSRSTAYRLMRIARHFNAAIAQRYGVEKLEAALRYLQATPEAERPGDLLAAEIRIRDDQGRFESISLHDATARQINEAAALLRNLERRTRVPKRIDTRVRRLTRALPASPTGTSRGERVRITRGTDGRLALSFQGIPVDDIDAFIVALREHLQ